MLNVFASPAGAVAIHILSLPWIASSLRSSQRLHFPVFASPASRGVAIHGKLDPAVYCVTGSLKNTSGSHYESP